MFAGRLFPQSSQIFLEGKPRHRIKRGIVSQSTQFAPFMHDYLYDDSTPNKHMIYNPEITVENTYKGSAVYVTVPSLFKLLRLIESITGSKPCRL